MPRKDTFCVWAMATDVALLVLAEEAAVSAVPDGDVQPARMPMDKMLSAARRMVEKGRAKSIAISPPSERRGGILAPEGWQSGRSRLT